MPVLLDSAPLTIPEPSLAMALDAARSAAEARGRVISEIRLDGRPVADEALAAIAGRPLDPASELRFTTADPVELVAASFGDAVAGLERVRAHQSAAARAIQTGSFDRALPDLSEAFTIWETARRVLSDGCSLLGINPDSLHVEVHGEQVSVAGAIRLLVSRLVELKRALGAQDWCGISDVLAYDLPGDAELWRGMLGALADKLPDLR